MCLENCKQIQTEEDIVCYKIFFEEDGMLTSPLHKCYWKKGKEKIDTKPLKFCYEETGSGHYYYTDRLKPFHENDSLIIDGGVFHSFKNLDDAILYAESFFYYSTITHFIVCECVIPAKNELLFEGKTRICNNGLADSYGSQRMMVVRPIKYVYRHNVMHII